MAKKPKWKLTAENYVARFKAEKAVLQRVYCNMFKCWLTCPFKPCRRARACSGDQDLCLKRAVDRVPRETQWQARQDIFKTMPATAGAPEFDARGLMPRELCEVN